MAPFIQILSVFLQLQSWFCIGMFCKRTIFCVNYMRIHVLDVSDYSDNKSLDSDSDIPTTSSHIQLRSSTGPLTPQFPQLFFSHTMSRNHSESIWQAWHFSDNSQQTQDSGRLFKILPTCEYSVQKFTSVYSPKQLSPDEAMIPWLGHRKFRTYNPGKITKDGVPVSMMCEAESGYVCNMEIYSAERKKLENTMFSLLDRNLGQSHHIYQDNFYNSVRLAETLLDRNVRVCGTMSANRGIPRDLEGEGKHLKKGQSAFRRNGDVMVQLWKDKTCANAKYDP